MSDKRIFTKPILTIEQQIDLLESRGLLIEDRNVAKYYLNYIGYYRLSGYLHSFKQQDGLYAKGYTFNMLLNVYVFDRKLRIITFDAIERIEVALRSCMTNIIGAEHGPYWFLNKSLFSNTHNFEYCNSIIRRETIEKEDSKRDVFIRHYYNSYASPEIPPSWMVCEILSMGAISSIYKHLDIRLRKKVAVLFGVDEKVLSSFLHSLVYTRNLCAHHAMLWNRVFTIKPILMKRYRHIIETQDRFFAQAFIIELLLSKISRHNHWEEKIKMLFSEYHDVEIGKMGFAKNWDGFNIS